MVPPLCQSERLRCRLEAARGRLALEIKKFCQTSPKGEEGRYPARNVGCEKGKLFERGRGGFTLVLASAAARRGGTFRSESRGRPKWVRTTSCFDDRTHCFERAKGLCGTGIGCGGG